MRTTRLVAIACVTMASWVTAARIEAAPVQLNLYADDFGEAFLDGTLLGRYDNPAAAGNIIVSLDLAPGEHDLLFTYRNRSGTNRLGFSWKLGGDTDWVTIPEANLRSRDAAGVIIEGLRADYFDLGGTYQFTRYGEGPIVHGADSFTVSRYEDRIGLWAGIFGPSAQFAAVLQGALVIPGAPADPTPVPEPALLTLMACAAACAARRLRRPGAQH